MRLEEAAYLKLTARRTAPHHLQVCVVCIRDARSRSFPWRWAVHAEVCGVFRSEPSGRARAFHPGDPILFGVEHAVRRDLPLREQPIGPIIVCVNQLESARFLEVFLDRDLTVAAGQVTPIECPTEVPRMSVDDPELVRLVAALRAREEKTRSMIMDCARRRRAVERTIAVHATDAFAPFDITVFEHGGVHVARVMLPNGHPALAWGPRAGTDAALGCLRRFVKSERRTGRVSMAIERICCTRSTVVRRMDLEGGTAVFLA